MNHGKICCAVDLSDASERVVRDAAGLAARCGAVLTLVHVDETAPAELADSGAPAAVAGHDRSWRMARLDALREVAEAITGRVVFMAILTGDAAEEIVRYAAAHDADLIVLGTHGNSGMRRPLLGSVAEAVVLRAPCEVLVVRQKEVAERSAESSLVEEYVPF